jgi:transposase-like protein
MADGYEPTSAVSQNAAAGAAMFGAPQPNQALGFSQLQQQRQLAQQGMQADERRAAEEMQRFQGGQGLAQEQLKFGREQMQQNLQEGREERQSRMKLQQDSQQFQQQLQTQMLERNKQLKMAELEFAKANAQRREALAPQLMQLRKDAADISGKVGAYKILETQGQEALARFLKQAGETRETMRKSNEDERAIGSRSAKSAASRMYEDAVNSSKDSAQTLSNMFGDSGYDVAEFEDSIGYDLLKPTGLGAGAVDDLSGSPDFSGAKLSAVGIMGTDGVTARAVGYDPEKGARNIIDIDDSAVSSKANILLSKNIARAISEQTGDKIAPDAIREAIDSVVKMGDDVGDQAVLLQKLGELGVSPEVMRSAMLSTAHMLDGTDEGSPLSRTSIMKQMEETLPNSPKRLALEATLKMVDTMQQRARTAAANLPGQDLAGMDAMVTYIERAISGGGKVNRSELAGLVQQYKGTEDDLLRDAILADTRLGELEALGADPLGQIRRNIASETRRGEDISLNRMDLERMIQDESSSDIQVLLDELKRMR